MINPALRPGYRLAVVTTTPRRAPLLDSACRWPSGPGVRRRGHAQRPEEPVPDRRCAGRRDRPGCQRGLRRHRLRRPSSSSSWPGSSRTRITGCAISSGRCPACRSSGPCCGCSTARRARWWAASAPRPRPCSATTACPTSRAPPSACPVCSRPSSGRWSARRRPAWWPRTRQAGRCRCWSAGRATRGAAPHHHRLDRAGRRHPGGRPTAALRGAGRDPGLDRQDPRRGHPPGPPDALDQPAERSLPSGPGLQPGLDGRADQRRVQRELADPVHVRQSQVGGRTFTNHPRLRGLGPEPTFSTDFAAGCSTAFATLSLRLTGASR